MIFVAGAVLGLDYWMGVPEDAQQQILDANAEARIKGLQAALAILAVLATVALAFTGLIPATRKSEGDYPGPYQRREQPMAAGGGSAATT